VLAIGRAIDNGAQGLGHRLRRCPRQAHDLGADAGGCVAQIGIVQRRMPGQQAMQQQPCHQHISLGGLTLQLT
jgi:hypothetical protein